jgi:light-regulated signal transduction histidine kinase (bacteriophytochrome)
MVQAKVDLQKQTEELSRSNRDLEQFAYAASHDLQEPLRAVTGCMQLLEARCRGKLDERGDEFMKHAVDGATRMQKLIEDLLAFSRVGTRGAELKPVECAAAVANALENLSVSITEKHAVIECGELPAVIGDLSQLALLFQNLVGNALKFCGEMSPRISISARREGADWTICIRDNGIGIDPQYFERIFVIFQRLHTRKEYPGTGMGLALCKRIVERHGGRIWVESGIGKGATFCFTLRSAATAQGSPKLDV